MNLRPLLLFALIAAACSSVQARNWRDRSGKFQVEAEYVGYRNGKVLLKTAAGKSLSIDVQRLSVDDQMHVAELRNLTTQNPFTGVGDVVKLDCRQAERRAELLRQYGGSERSEAAVAAARKWIVAHQLPDGGWSFELRCQCANHGSLAGRNAATAMALLPLLANGSTHQGGEHQEAVRKGLLFLTGRLKHQPGGGSFSESGGTMYSQGLAARALCEAYQLTGDRKLRDPAQKAIDFIVFAQDPVNGGWRYTPRQPGDTSVTGWQLAALQTAAEAGLEVPPQVFEQAERFLDSVASGDGSFYGYTTPGRGPGTTASGLLGRIRLGWTREDQPLGVGADYLLQRRPSKSSLYYNYFVTQTLFHYQGEPWQKWNPQMRDMLLKAQAGEGHEAGSWHLGGDHGSERAGRLYCTSLATMILQTYYRNPPLLGE